jgi:hypothetical protein
VNKRHCGSRAVDLSESPGYPIYVRLSTVLDAPDFDRFVEDLCSGFYAPVMGRPSLPPGRYFRLLLIGYFEGLDAERGIAWRGPIPRGPQFLAAGVGRGRARSLYDFPDAALD